MKQLTDHIYEQTAKYGLIVIFVLFFFLEFVGKQAYFNWGGTSLQLYVKGVLLLIIGILLLGRFQKLKQAWVVFALPIIYVIGQLVLENSFSTNSIVIFIKFMSPLLFFLLFTIVKPSEKDQILIFKIFEWGMIVNSGLIILGYLGDISIFESYRGERFGYSGLFLSPGVASYAYLLTLFYFVIGAKASVWRNWKFAFIFISCLLIGTKAIYLGQIVVLIYLLSLLQFRFKNLLIAITLLMSLVATYFFFFEYGLFNKVRESEGLLSALLSYRDKLLIENTIPYVQENWTFLNYLFGGVSNYDMRSQMEIIDLFFFWGGIGGLVYLMSFIKTYVTFRMSKMLWVFALLFIIIIFLAGNFFVYSTITIFLLMVRERILQIE